MSLKKFEKLLNWWVMLFYGPNGDGAPFGTKPDADLNFAVATMTIMGFLIIGTLWLLSTIWNILIP